MSAGARLATFAVLLAAVFSVAFVAGRTIDPQVNEPAAAHPQTDPASHDGEDGRHGD
jgi:hypothetical protein